MGLSVILDGGRECPALSRSSRLNRSVVPTTVQTRSPVWRTTAVNNRRAFMNRRRLFGALAALSLAAGLASTSAHAQNVLRISAIPDEAPTELQRKFSRVAAYLEKEVGMKVEYTPVTDYAAVVEALAARKVDLAWLGGFTFVQARLRTGNAIPIVQRAEDEKFTIKFIANTASGIKGLADLKGRNFTFGSVSSTSGHLMPRYFLQERKITPEKDFKRVA